mmetsp:Transcript_15749/g.47635  ORF Transcript_15749/g.47635 Transcript_15749/m.47635 type:complete len:318 (+) Transcript_15749:1373-2326(+)
MRESKKKEVCLFVWRKTRRRWKNTKNEGHVSETTATRDDDDDDTCLEVPAEDGAVVAFDELGDVLGVAAGAFDEGAGVAEVDEVFVGLGFEAEFDGVVAGALEGELDGEGVAPGGVVGVHGVVGAGDEDDVVLAGFLGVVEVLVGGLDEGVVVGGGAGADDEVVDGDGAPADDVAEAEVHHESFLGRDFQGGVALPEGVHDFLEGGVVAVRQRVLLLRVRVVDREGLAAPRVQGTALLLGADAVETVPQRVVLHFGLVRQIRRRSRLRRGVEQRRRRQALVDVLVLEGHVPVADERRRHGHLAQEVLHDLELHAKVL